MVNVLGAIWHVVWICSLYIIVSTIVSVIVINGLGYLIIRTSNMTYIYDDVVNTIEKNIVDTIRKSIGKTIRKAVNNGIKETNKPLPAWDHGVLEKEEFYNAMVSGILYKTINNLKTNLYGSTLDTILNMILNMIILDRIFKISLAIGVLTGLILGIMHLI